MYLSFSDVNSSLYLTETNEEKPSVTNFELCFSCFKKIRVIKSCLGLKNEEQANNFLVFLNYRPYAYDME